MHRAIEIFTGQMPRAELVPELINHPANAMNVQGDAHDSMDQKLAWGIEARLVDHKVRSCAIRSLLWCHIMGSGNIVSESSGQRTYHSLFLSTMVMK